MTFEFTVDTDDENNEINQASDEIEEITAAVEIDYTKPFDDPAVDTIEEHVKTSLRTKTDNDGKILWDDLIDTLQPFVNHCDFIAGIIVTPDPPHDDLPDEKELGATIPTSTNINIIPGLGRR